MHKHPFIKNKVLWFTVSFILVCLFYNYYHIFQLRPHSIHQWRQTDCLSITTNFYENGMDFFSPEIHNLISDNKTSGKTAGEFPILYYFIAVLWKIFGVHEWIYRLVGLLLVFLGLYSVFRITDYFLRDTFWSIGIAMLLFTSPIFANYGISFITNVSALCIVFYGWWMFLRFYDTKKERFLYFAMALFCLAGLMKVSTLISFLFLLIIFLGERLPIFNRKKIYLFSKARNILPFILVLFIVFLWYYYAEKYNGIHGGKYTFNSLWPIWELDHSKIMKYLSEIRKGTIYQLFNPVVLYSYILMFLAIIITPKKHTGFFYYGIYILLGGTLTYILFWFQAFDVHDYYYIDLLLLLIFIPVAFFIYLKNHFGHFLKSVRIKIIFSLFLLLNIYYCREMLELRYFPKEKKEYLMIGSQSLVDFFKWFDWNYPMTMQPLESIGPYLTSIGITQNDVVISIPDESINISLYLMDKKGFTGFGYTDLQGETRIKAFVSAGAKYLIISDKNLLEKDYLQPFLENKIGEYQGVMIFDLREPGL